MGLSLEGFNKNAGYVSPRRKRSEKWQPTRQVLVQHLVSMFVATIAERVIHKFDSRKVELIMSVLIVSSDEHVYESTKGAHIACLSFGELHKHPTLPRNCPSLHYACWLISAAPYHEASRLSMIFSFGGRRWALFKVPAGVGQLTISLILNVSTEVRTH